MPWSHLLKRERDAATAPVTHMMQSLLHKSRVERSPRVDVATEGRIRSKFPNNYFGLPPYSMQQTAGGLAYQCRARRDSDFEEQSPVEIADIQEKERDIAGDVLVTTATFEKTESNFVAQRKVSSALLTMVNNPLMMKHFLNKGGFEAVMKLVKEARDHDVLVNCSQCLIEVSSKEENTQQLVERGIFQSIVILQDSHDELLRQMTAVILSKLSAAHNQEDLLLLNGMLSSIQYLLVRVHRTESLCFLLLSLTNIATAILANEAELAIRFCFQATKKIDVVRSFRNAIFVADLYNNFSRISHYSSLLIDEGVLPLMLHVIDSYSHDDILRVATETIANLSINRKNRREIASSGISSRLSMLFEKGSSATRASVLLIMGNLLSSGLFHDKVANTQTITNMLDNLMDINYPRQFNAVAYCLCQLSKNEISSEVLLTCGIVPITLGFLRRAPAESIDYLWTVLVNIMSFDQFFPKIVRESASIVNELYEEVRHGSSAEHQQMCVVTIGHTLSRQQSFRDHLDTKLIDLFVITMKTLFSSPLACGPVQSSALINLINLVNYCPESRAVVLSTDLIDLFHQNGIDDDKMNVLYVSLLNIISNDESCCYRLLDNGVHKLLVSLQDSFQRLVDGPRHDLKKSKRASISAKGMQNLSHSLQSSKTSSRAAQEMAAADELTSHAEGELGKELTASIIHNLALKRPVLGPGVLSMILNLAKNAKTLRVLHCIRALANMSVHSKSKVIISKECRRLVPMLTVIMRCGCDEAERVQHYCAIILCNILALSLEKSLLTELVKTGAVVDLMVVTLLRINSISTKETLTKAFFNMLGRQEVRESLVLQLDILAALIELSKLEYVDLLELCMRTIYNITCDLKAGSGVESNYAAKLSALKVPSMMISRLVYSPNNPGSITNRPIRVLLGMAVANMSFNKTLVLELALSESKLADAMGRVHALGAEEMTYCALVTIYNLSRYAECRVLAGSKAVPLIVDILGSTEKAPSVICVKLGIATLCNMSMMQVFFDQMTTTAVAVLVQVLSSPQLHLSIKADAVQAIYNLSMMHQPARSALINADIVAALWKLVKLLGSKKGHGDDKSLADNSKEESVNSLNEDFDEDYLLTIVSRTIKCLCEESSDVLLLRKMLTDGIMNIILKLSKIEMNELKIDMSFCIYLLTRGSENLKVLKRDSVDIVFWLTLHDTLNIHDLILRNVSRALRSFAMGAEEALVLVKHERFFTVLKELIKSKNEDVLWQTAGMLYNMMHVEVCLKRLVEKGLIQFVFDLAASGFEHVKHVCSACLHMVPESMPNMDDPIALELVLCLLEAQGEKFAEVTERPVDVLAYDLAAMYKDSALVHQWTNFLPSWAQYSCLVDTVFSPSLIFTPRPSSLQALPAPSDPSSIICTEKHRKLQARDYDDFHRDGLASDSVSLTSFSPKNTSTTIPPPVEHEPPTLQLPNNQQRTVTMRTAENHSADTAFRDSRARSPDQTAGLGVLQRVGSKRMNHSSSLPLLSTPLPVPENTLEALRKSTTQLGKPTEVLPSHISYKSVSKL